MWFSNEELKKIMQAQWFYVISDLKELLNEEPTETGYVCKVPNTTTSFYISNENADALRSIIADIESSGSQTKGETDGKEN